MSRVRVPGSRLLAACIVAAFAAACAGGSSVTPTDRETGVPTSAPIATDAATPSAEPGESPTSGPSATDEPTSTPGPSAATAACSGTDANRTFFAQAAAAIEWPVYCLVLDDGWFLADGSYRLADGGELDVTYRTSTGLELALLEGDLCHGQDVETCAPLDAVIAGTAAFGDREAGIGQLGGGLVIDVDRGATPTWRLIGTGIDEAAFRAIGAAALVVAD